MSDVLNYIQNDPAILGVTNLFLSMFLLIFAKLILKKVFADEVTGGAFSDPFIKILAIIIFFAAFFGFAFCMLKPYVEILIESVQRLN